MNKKCALWQDFAARARILFCYETILSLRGKEVFWMNEVLNAIEQRRSVRGYEDRALTQEQIDALVKAALESPSARNAQPWHFSFVTDQALLAQCGNSQKQRPDRPRDFLRRAAVRLFKRGP